MPVTKKLRCRVERIQQAGEGVYLVDLFPQGAVPRFRPGQFLHLALDEYDPSSFWPESRIFSIASSPRQRETLKIAYSVRGRYTARMAAELREGIHVWVKLPYGDFVVEDRTEVVLFAGGTGITAFTAFLEGLEPDLPRRVCLAYGVRSSDLLLYGPLVEEKRKSLPRLKVRYFIEGEPVHVSRVRGDVVPGCISVEAMWPLIREPHSCSYYLSGPPGMLTAISTSLRLRGIREDSIRIDAWE